MEIKAQPGPQEKFLSTEADICIYGGSAGGGKVQKNQSLVLTPWGYKEIGDLEIGTTIINPDGSHQKVINIYPHKDHQFYKLTFNDGSTCHAGLEHLWVSWKNRVITKKARRQRLEGINKDKFSLFPESAKVINTETMIQWIEEGYNPLIPVTLPVRFNSTSNEKNRIDPYLLGCMLGDGCLSNKSSLRFTTIDLELRDYVMSKLSSSWDNKKQVNIHLTGNSKFISKLSDYSLLGTYSHTKFIPKQYLIGNIKDREALLQGLMDTDGTIDERGHLSYTTTSLQLCNDIKNLIETLGGWSTISESTGSYLNSKGNRVFCKQAYTLYIRIHDSIKPFRLKRKLARLVSNKGRLYRTVISIEKDEVCDGRCITVNNPNRLYLTNNCIVTHNSFAILLEPLRHIENPVFRGVIFRRVSPQIKNPGGLLDESQNIYSHFDGKLKDSALEWTFPSGAKIKLAQMEHEKNKHDWQGSQIPYIGFDEITHFEESQVVYMMSRNRSASGIPGYIRGTCNPDCDSWVRSWVDWWIGPEGFPIKERSGVLRYFVRINGEMVWADTKAELEQQFGKDSMPRSFTFIASSIYDNKILMKNDPSYLGSLKALSRVERERLLEGNWDVKPESGMYFQREWCEIVKSAPAGLRLVRYWDRAATLPSETNKDPDYTAGVLMGKCRDGYYYIIDVKRFRGTSATVERTIKNCASADGRRCRIRLEEEPGASGKTEAAYMVRQLAGYQAKSVKVNKDKLTRFLPFSAQAEAGNVRIVEGSWNEAFFNELENFVGDGVGHDDQADGTSGAFNELCEHPSIVSDEITMGHFQSNRFGIS